MVSNRAVAGRLTAKQHHERDFSTKKRASMDLADFGDPEKRAFPVLSQDDLDNAARLLGHADNPAAVKKRLIAIARRKGLSLPDSWKDEGGKQAKEAVPFQPRTKIATIKTCWLEDDAISLNGRQYPREAVDRLIQSAQVKLSDPNALPITCYLSHDKADQDSTGDIVGKVSKVWREGIRAYANIDIPDTTAGRDFATLAAGKYIRSQSLRASNAFMKLDPHKSFPQVTGESLSLDGIDCTTRPGLPQARIEDITESHEVQALTEVFHVQPASLIVEEISSMPTNIEEEGINPITSGDSVGMTSDDPRDTYSKRMYTMPPGASSDEAPQSLNDVHDRLAYVMGMACGPETMEAIQRFGTGVVLEREKLQEAGAKLSSSTKGHLKKAHDGVAGHLGMACADSSAGNDGMQDGDSDDMSSSDKEHQTFTRQDVEHMVKEALRSNADTQQPDKETKEPMTKEEAIRLLAESGYELTPPKTKEEVMQEQFDAKLAEQRKQMEEQQVTLLAQMEEMKKLLTERQNPYATHVQRKSLVEGATQETPRKPYYRAGDYMREKLRDVSLREQLVDRSYPLPDDMNPEHLLKELQWELLGMYDAVYGLEGNPRIFGQ